MITMLDLAVYVYLALSFAAPQDLPDAESKGDVHVVSRGLFSCSLEVDGRFVPGTAEELAFRPDGYAGGCKILEVCEHGSTVLKGDLLLRFDTEAIEDQIENMRLEVRSAEQALLDAKARERIEGMDLQASLDRVDYDLATASKRLNGYEQIKKGLDDESTRLTFLYREHSITDQEDNLDQLGKMYREDELTEETEEIVLKRNKRNLDRLKKSFELQKSQQKYSEEFTEKVSHQGMIRDVDAKKRAQKKVRTMGDSTIVFAKIAVERAGIKLEKVKKSLEELISDREKMRFTSPADGLLLHCDSKLAGGELSKDGTAGMNKVLLTVADPGSLRVMFTVAESDIFKVKKGLAVKVKPKAMPEHEMDAVLETVPVFPSMKTTKWECYAAVEGKHIDFLPGMTCSMEVFHKELENVIAVPEEAISVEAGKKTCQVITDSVIEKRAVVVGESGGGRVVIKEGLEEGERILIPR